MRLSKSIVDHVVLTLPERRIRNFTVFESAGPPGTLQSRSLIVIVGALFGVACRSALELEQYVFQAGEADAGGAGTSSGSGPDGAQPRLDASTDAAACESANQACLAPEDASASTCGICEPAHALGVCTDGGCDIERCAGPWLDFNGSVADGCERGDVPLDALSLWFMANEGVTNTESFVSAWQDQSPGGLAATQGAPAQMPTVVSSAGLPMLEFDGVDDRLQLPSGFASFEGATFFAVIEAMPNEGCAGILSFSNGAGQADVEFGRHTPGLLYFEVFDRGVEGTARAFESGRRLVVSVLQDATGAVELRINRAVTGSGNVALPDVVIRQQNFIGKNLYPQCPGAFYGRIGEIILYTRGLLPADRDRVESYLFDKWQL